MPNERFDLFLESYSARRTIIQRVMNVFFVFYVLGAAYTSVSSAAGRVGKRNSKKSNKDIRKGKPDRVAVRYYS